METDYDYYLLGCEARGVRPLSPWRFRVAYAWYQGELGKPFGDLLALRPKNRAKVVARLGRYKDLADLVILGHNPTRPIQSAAGETRLAVGSNAAPFPTQPPMSQDDDPGTAAAGDRVPETPPEPTLSGAAARPLPTPDAPDLSFWRV